MSFGAIVTWPFAWLMLNLYELFSNYGLAVIAFALVIKLILLPFQMKSKRSMMRTARLAPLVNEINKKYEGNKQKAQMEVSKLYKEEKINPMSGCLWSLIPFPILIALYSVIRQPLTSMMRLGTEAIATIESKITAIGAVLPEATNAYREIQMTDIIHQNWSAFSGIDPNLVDIDYSFLGLNLGQQPQWNFFTNVDWGDSSVWLPALGLFLIPVISAALSYFSMKISNKSNPTAQQAQGSMKGMMLIMPLVSLYIGFVMPAALGIYWIAGSVFAILQDLILNKYYNKKLDAEDAVRMEKYRAKEAELEKKRLETEKLREAGATKVNKNTSKKKLQTAEKTKEEARDASARAAEKAKRKAALGIVDVIPESQVGNRRFARGRAYVEDRFENPEGAEEATAAAAAAAEIDEEVDKEFGFEPDTLDAEIAAENSKAAAEGQEAAENNESAAAENEEKPGE